MGRSDGRETTLPEPDSGRSARLIETNGRPVAALIHDPSLDDEKELVDAVSAAAAIALENARLQAELRARLDELTSRGRGSSRSSRTSDAASSATSTTGRSSG